MEEFADKIVEIIGDYRTADNKGISKERIIMWVNQFDQTDREFILNELLHILPKSYISKSKAIETMEELFEYLAKYYKHDNINEFLSYSIFLDCQEQHKSQTKLLEFLDEIAEEKYQTNLNSCGKKGSKYWIYVDDVLATGGTFLEDVSNKIEEYEKDQFIKDKIEIVCIFFFLHTWGMANIKYRVQKKFGEAVANCLKFHHVHEISNNPFKNSHISQQKFNLAYPIDEENEYWNNYLSGLNASRNGEYAYRRHAEPSVESFYSSSQNRKRFEAIILNKGIEILQKVGSLSSNVRPLGITLPSNKTFGTGSYAFTWRNISNTCPIVFWWENHGWIPLFHVVNRGIH